MVFSTAFSVVDNPTIMHNDAGEKVVIDSLSLKRRHIEAVKSLAIWRDTVRAERIWREIIAEDSLYAPALYNLGELPGVTFAEAMDFTERAYRVDTTNKWYVSSYGRKLLRVHDYDRALPIFKQLMVLDKQIPAPYYYLAQLYLMRSMPYSAIAVLDSADIRMVSHELLSRMKQDLLLETRQFDRAIAEGQKIVGQTPYDAEAHLALARAYAYAGRDSLAMVSYENAYQVDTTNLETIKELWDFYVDQENATRVLELEERIISDSRVSEAEKIRRVANYTNADDVYRDNYFKIGSLIHKLAVDYPTNRDVVALYTKHLYYGGQEQEALDYIHRRLEDDNVTASDYILAIQLDEVMEQGMQYILDMDRGVELFPENIYLVSLSAYMHSKLGAYNSAIKLLRWALRYSENDEDRSSLWCTIGDMYHEQGKDKKAFKAYDKSLDLNPENALALNNYAYFLAISGGSLDKALAMAKLAMVLESNSNYNTLDTYAWILHLMGRDDEAKKYMTQALSLNGQQSSTLLMHYADVLWALGEKFMAEVYWKKAIEMGYDKEELEAHIAALKSQNSTN